MRYEDASQGGQPADNSHTVARPDVDTLPAGSYGPAGGNTISGSGTTSGASGADSVGAPPAKIVEVHGAGGATTVASGNFEAAGQFGVLTMDAAGNFNYVRNPNTPDGVKDVFNYTLADASGANSSTTLTIDIGQVAAAAAGQSIVALPAGVELSDIHVNGRDLIVDMPDGTQMVIPGGAVFVPQLMIGDVQVPPTNLAALLIDSEPQPAAGPAQSSGADWSDPVPPLDPGVPLGDLIPPTELVFTPPEFKEPGFFEASKPTVVIETPDNPAGVVDASESVNEKGLPGRNDGEPAGSGEIADGNPFNNSDTSETNTGTIVFTAPDGLQSVTIDGVAITAVGQTIAGQFGTMTITSIDVATGQIGYSYTLADNTSGDNTQDLFNVVVTDKGGNAATASLTVHIIDDVPTARNDTDSTDLVTHIATGNVVTGADTTSGSAGADTVGADNAQVTAVSGAGGSSSTFDESGNLIVNGQFGTLTIHADGSYSYAENKGAPGGSVDTFTYTLTDGDGDSSNATLTISNPDHTPTVVIQTPDNPDGVIAASESVFEKGLPARGSEPAGSGEIADGNPNNNSDTSETNTGTIVFNAQDGLGSITVDGNAITQVGQTIAGQFGTMTITSINLATGQIGYSYTLADNTSGDNTADHFTVVVTDSDGDQASATLTVHIVDDVPTAHNDTDLTDANTHVASGNVITGADTTSGASGADVVGADNAQVSAIAGAGGADSSADGSGNFAIAGQFGTLVINQDGSYTYTENQNAPGNSVDTFTYTLTDGDGDTSTATLTITNPNHVPMVTPNALVQLDDDALAGGNPGGVGDGPDAVNTTGTLSGSGGDGQLTWDLQTTGAPSGFSYVDGPNGSVLVQQVQDGQTVTVLTITVDAATGAYSVAQNAPIDHAPGGNENNADFTINYTVTDVDGDSAQGSLNIEVNDDTPVVTLADTTAPTLTVDETDLSVNATASFASDFTVSFGADGPATANSLTYTLAISATGADSGLVDTASGNHVFLFLENGVVVGREGADATAAANGPEVFTVTVDSSGNVTLDQIRAVVQPDGTNPDTSEGVSLASGNLVSLTATATDHDGDTASQSLNIGQNLVFQDDGPTITASGAPPSLVVDESDLAVNATASFASLFTADAGADGQQGPIAYALAVSSSGADTGLIDTATGNHVFLFLENGEVVGREGTSAAAAANGPEVFTASVDASGNVTLDQIRAVVQPDGTNPDTSEGVTLSSGLVTLTATITDNDGDQASATKSISQGFTFDDDGPTISATGAPPSLTVDESDLSVNATASIAGVFTSSFGADGAGTITYTLGISSSGADSGIIDTASGNHVFLFLENGVVVGREGTSAAAAAGGPEVFTVSIDSSGNVTLDQIRAVVQPNGTNPDTSEGVTLSSAGLVTVTGTITDKDGDSSTATANIGQSLNFDDDGPTISASSTQPVLTVDETNLAVNATSSFAGVFTSSFGADGAGSITYTLGISANGADSGLVDTATGQHIFLVLNNGVVEGHVGSTSGALAFTVSVAANGDVTLDQIRAVVHPNGTNPDTSEGVTLGSDGLVTLTGTITDKDGDSSTATANIGQNLVFQDDGPTITASSTQPALTVDETNLAVNATASFAGVFTAQFGADGPATANSLTYALGVSSSGADSGLIDTATGNHVFLFLENGVVVGREGTSAAAAALSGPEVFTLTADSSGNVTLDQIRAVVQGTASNPDTSEGVSLASDNLVTLTATATDKDGDQASATANIGQNLTFDDDGPTAQPDTNSTAAGTTLTVAAGSTSDVLHNDAPGADGFHSGGGVVGVGTGTNTSVSLTSGVGTVVHGTFGDLTLNADGSYTYVAKPNVTGVDHFVYTIEDGDGDTSTTTLNITVNPVRAAVGTDSTIVSEEVLLAGTEHGVGGDNDSDPTNDVLVNSGNITLSDTITGATFTTALTAPSGTFTSGGTAITWALTNNGQTLTGTAGSTTVIVVTIDNSGHYTVTLSAPIDTPNGVNAGENGGDSILTFGVTAHDNFGNTLTNGSLTVNVEDDHPIASGDVNNTAAGTTLTVTSVSTSDVLHNDVPGADGFHAGGGVIGVEAGTNTSAAVTSGVGTVIHGTFGDLTLQSDGSYTYAAKPNVTGVDHFVYTIEDGDGDTSTTTLNITVNPVTATVGASSTVVSEEVLLAGTEHGGDTDNDGSNDVLTNSGTIALSDSISGATFTTHLVAPPGTFTSGGTAITWTLSNSDHTLTGKAGTTTVLVATLDNSGHYTVTLSAPIDTPNGVNPGENGGDSILNIGVTATDNFGNTLTSGTLTVNVEDDAPTLGTVQDQVVSNDPTQTPAIGSLHFTAGADGAGSAMTITADTTGITSGGFSLVTHQAGDVLTAYQDANHNGVYDSATDTTAVFTITVDPTAGTSGEYTFDLITPLDPTVTTIPVGSGSSFGVGPSQSVVVTDNASGTHLVLVTGWQPTDANGQLTSAEETAWLNGGNPSLTQTSNVNGSTAGWGLANNNFDAGEFMRFDFGTLNDYDGNGPFTPPAPPAGGIANASVVTFSFANFSGTDKIDFVAHYTDGTTANFTVLGSSGDTGITIGSPAGAELAWVDAYESNGTIKLNLVSVGIVNSALDQTINATVQLADGDGDQTSTQGFTVEVKDGGTPLAPNSVAKIALNTNSLMASNDNLEQQGQRVFSVGQNAALMGALAAAGLDAEHLTLDGHHLALNFGDRPAMMPLQTATLGSASTLSVGAEQPVHSVASMPVVHSAQPVQHSAPIHDMVAAAHPLGGATSQQPAMTQLLHGSTAAGSHATAANFSSVTAPGVIMPSAQQLAVAAHGSPQPVHSVAGNAPQHDEVVGKVLADSLHGGQGQGPNIDTLLHSLPVHAAGGALQALATHAGSFVSIEHMAMMGPYGGPHSALTVDMVMHQDAPPPAHG